MNDDLDLDLTCPTCGGTLELIGHLGRALHSRCRHCGLGHVQYPEPASVTIDDCDWSETCDCAAFREEQAALCVSLK
jgi:hypothetical protein